MSGLAGYDAWKTYDAAGERDAALQSLIDTLRARHARLAAALKADPKNKRLAAIADRAACFVRYAERALDAAIDDRADDGYGDEDDGRDDR